MIKVRIHLGGLFLCCAAWAYLFQKSYLSLALRPLVAIPLIALFALALYALYEEEYFDVALTREDLIVLGVYVLFLVALHWRGLTLSMAGDELYNGERAVRHLHMIPLMAAHGKLPASLLEFSVRECSFYLSFLTLAGLSLVVYVYQRFARHQNKAWRYLAIFAALLLFGAVTNTPVFPVETYSPLWPLVNFLSQSFFSLTDVSFRLPGVFAAAVLSFVFYRALRDKISSLAALAGGLFINFIPTVMHVTPLVESSFWCFFFTVLLMIATERGLRENKPKLFIAAGACLAIGGLFRHTILLCAPLFILITLLKADAVSRRKALFPLILVVPFLLSVAKLGYSTGTVYRVTGHDGWRTTYQLYDGQGLSPSMSGFIPPAGHQQNTISASLSAEGLRNVYHSVRSGKGLRGLFDSSGPLWLALLVFLAACCLIQYRSMVCVYFLLVPLGYGLFHSIAAGTTVGRYQAEYIAPVTAFAIYLYLTRRGLPRSAWWVGAYLALNGLYINNTITQDVYTKNYLSARLTSEAYMPYKETLRYLQKQRAQGKFVLIGGGSQYGRLVYWMRGFNFQELENHKVLQRDFKTLIYSQPKAKDLAAFMTSRDVRHILVQHGSPIESGWRDPSQENAICTLPLNLYKLNKSFLSPYGGAITMLSIDPYETL